MPTEAVRSFRETAVVENIQESYFKVPFSLSAASDTAEPLGTSLAASLLCWRTEPCFLLDLQRQLNHK